MKTKKRLLRLSKLFIQKKSPSVRGSEHWIRIWLKKSDPHHGIKRVIFSFACLETWTVCSFSPSFFSLPFLSQFLFLSKLYYTNSGVGIYWAFISYPLSIKLFFPPTSRCAFKACYPRQTPIIEGKGNIGAILPLLGGRGEGGNCGTLPWANAILTIFFNAMHKFLLFTLSGGGD